MLCPTFTDTWSDGSLAGRFAVLKAIDELVTKTKKSKMVAKCPSTIKRRLAATAINSPAEVVQASVEEMQLDELEIVFDE